MLKQLLSAFIIFFLVFFFDSCSTDKKTPYSNVDQDIVITEVPKVKPSNGQSGIQVSIKDKATGKPLFMAGVCIKGVCYDSDTLGIAGLSTSKKKITMTIKCYSYHTKELRHLNIDLSKNYKIAVLLTRVNDPLY